MSKRILRLGESRVKKNPSKMDGQVTPVIRKRNFMSGPVALEVDIVPLLPVPVFSVFVSLEWEKWLAVRFHSRS